MGNANCFGVAPTRYILFYHGTLAFGHDVVDGYLRFDERGF
jgi:hypothetical protein